MAFVCSSTKQCGTDHGPTWYTLVRLQAHGAHRWPAPHAPLPSVPLVVRPSGQAVQLRATGHVTRRMPSANVSAGQRSMVLIGRLYTQPGSTRSVRRALCAAQHLLLTQRQIPVSFLCPQQSHIISHSLQPLLPVVPLVYSPCGQGSQLAALETGRTVSEKVLLGQAARAEPVQ
jgi:hypothetical protein